VPPGLHLEPPSGRGSIPPRWGDDPGSRAGPARGFAAGRGGRAVVPLRTPQNGSGGVKTGYGGEAPMQARPCSQEAACSRLMAVTQRRSPRALQTYPTTSASGRGEAPSSTAPHDDRRPDRRGPRKYRPHASHAPGTSTRPGARQAPARAGPRRAPGGVEGGRARQSESPSTDAGFVQSRIPLSFACMTCCIRDKPRRFAACSHVS
jgi:hypothetical protein